jgi:hypothetical protein
VIRSYYNKYHSNRSRKDCRGELGKVIGCSIWVMMPRAVRRREVVSCRRMRARRVERELYPAAHKRAAAPTLLESNSWRMHAR